MVAPLNTSALELPGTFVGIVQDAAVDNGILGALAPEKPTLFGPVSGATFSGEPRASIVGESEAKPASEGPTITSWRAEPVKAVVQVRASDEFMWADEDYQMGILRDLVAPSFGRAIGRFADLFTFHGINPATGTVSDKATKYLSQSTQTVAPAGAPTSELIASIKGLGGSVNGIAADKAYAFDLASEVYPEGHSLAGQPMYPSAGFGDINNWRGLKVATSSTVPGVPEMADSGIKAFIGDWSSIRWGFQRKFPLEVVEYGDPDNTGRDLKGHNEILFRSEAVIYVAIADVEKFAVVKEAAGA